MTTYGALGAAIIATIPDWLKVPVGLLIIGGFVAWVRPDSVLGAERFLGSRFAPPLLGFLAACGMVVAWGSLRQMSLLQDEAAYLLQAHLFSTGHWTDPTPPFPAFFEQPHVLVLPRLASKYFPGHSLLLTPGVWLGLPGLVPVMLLGLTGAMMFLLARDVLGPRLGPWPALLAYLLWMSLLGHHTWPRPSYMSEITTSALWLLGWWALLRWRDQRQIKYAVMLAICIGWGVITRPLTMLAYTVPAGAVMLIIVLRRRRWRDLVVAAACGALVLAIIPLWSARTTGNWRLTPHSLYTDQYSPWDVVGFGYRDVAPLRAVPPEVACLDSTFGPGHRLHQPRVLPGQFVARSWGLLDDTFSGWRRGLLVFALAALFAMPGELWLAVGSSAALVIAYLIYPQDPRYTIYSMEAQTTLVVVAALGVCSVAAAAAVRWGGAVRERARSRARQQVAWCVVGASVFLLPVTITTLKVTGQRHEGTDVPRREFLEAVDSLPQPRTVVFVRYPPNGPCQQPEHGLVANTPPLATARTWIVYDRGREDAELLRAAPDRVPYLFDVQSDDLRPLGSSARVAAEALSPKP